MTHSLGNVMIFCLIQVRKIQTECRIQAVLYMKVNCMKRCYIFCKFHTSQCGESKIFTSQCKWSECESLKSRNVKYDDETSVLECFQKFTDENMQQMFAEQTNIYTNFWQQILI